MHRCWQRGVEPIPRWVPGLWTSGKLSCVSSLLTRMTGGMRPLWAKSSGSTSLHNLLACCDQVSCAITASYTHNSPLFFSICHPPCTWQLQASQSSWQGHATCCLLQQTIGWCLSHCAGCRQWFLQASQYNQACLLVTRTRCLMHQTPRLVLVPACLYCRRTKHKHAAYTCAVLLHCDVRRVLLPNCHLQCAM